VWCKHRSVHTGKGRLRHGPRVLHAPGQQRCWGFKAARPLQSQHRTQLAALITKLASENASIALCMVIHTRLAVITMRATASGGTTRPDADWLKILPAIRRVTGAWGVANPMQGAAIGSTTRVGDATGRHPNDVMPCHFPLAPRLLRQPYFKRASCSSFPLANSAPARNTSLQLSFQVRARSSRMPQRRGFKRIPTPRALNAPAMTVPALRMAQLRRPSLRLSCVHPPGNADWHLPRPPATMSSQDRGQKTPNDPVKEQARLGICAAACTCHMLS
jgi:hypothetical protein